MTKLTIGLDIRKVKDFGIGTYIRTLMAGLHASNPDFLKLIFYYNRHKAPVSPKGIQCDGEWIEYASHRRSPFQKPLPTIPHIDLFHAPHYIVPDPAPTPLLLTVHDLIHLHPPPPATVSPFIKRYFSVSFESMKALYHRHITGQMLKARIRSAEKIICVSQSTAAGVLNDGLTQESKIVVIYNSIDPTFFEEPDQSALSISLSSLGLQAGSFVLYCGNDLYHKNIIGLLSAIHILKRRNKLDFKVVLAGPRRIEKIKKTAHHFGISENVFIVNQLKPIDYIALYRSAICLIHPSLAEGFGLPLIEAMACETPVICSDIPVLREISAGCAEFFNPYDIELISSKLFDFVVNSSQRLRLGKAGRAIAQRYSTEGFIRKHLDVYQSMIGN